MPAHAMTDRNRTLDVFRGATVALMILVNNPGDWSHVFAPLKHAPWHGCTPTDLVFPFFLFAVGNALSFVLPRLETAGTSATLIKIGKRTLLIFAIGLFLNWSPFIKWSGDLLVFKYWVDPMNPETGIRILGVLQRIALCYFFAALIIYFFKLRGAFWITALLLLGYWALCVIGNPTDPYSLSGWFGTDIDKKILGIPHLYKGEGLAFDPEGLMSTLPAITEVLFGYFVGHYIQEKGKNHEMLANLLIEELAARYDLPRVAPLSKWGAWQRTHPGLACGLKRGFTFYHHQPGQPWRSAPGRPNELLVAASPHDGIADTHWFRADFDHFLAREAQALGAVLCEGVKLRGVEFPAEGGAVLTGEGEGVVWPLRARRICPRPAWTPAPSQVRSTRSWKETGPRTSSSAMRRRTIPSSCAASISTSWDASRPRGRLRTSSTRPIPRSART